SCASSARTRRSADQELDDFQRSPSPEPDLVAESREGFDRVLAAISNLPQAEREVAILYYLQDRSQREVAAFHGVPVSTVNNRLRTARQHLRAGKGIPMSGATRNEYRLPTISPDASARSSARRGPSSMRASHATSVRES